jgi:hypothetical protein
LKGGKGDDTFVLGRGSDTVADFDAANDRLKLSSDKDYKLIRDGNDVLITQEKSTHRIKGADLDVVEAALAQPRDGSTVSINAADGTGICAEDELLFQVIGNAGGYVAADLTLGDSNLPAGSQVWFSLTGEEGSWGLRPIYTSGDLIQLSESGQGYFKVKLPDDDTRKRLRR